MARDQRHASATKQHLTLTDNFNMYFDSTRRARPSDTEGLSKTAQRMRAVGLLTEAELNYIEDNSEEVLKDIRK